MNVESALREVIKKGLPLTCLGLYRDISYLLYEGKWLRDELRN
ncbi:hypothetical protein Vsou_21700 [Vulcanisaeta souniana JCM 11219]|uniref:Uncharacterized protein n=1 Tax=Vulcanisaeta souniana JCM 11219 TaxID=1293586 RepID=A0ABN6ST84_9CREN|nr:hypothetical protein Vsou_21700 [Vulcanisaeta souniana JCM 11219]